MSDSPEQDEPLEVEPVEQTEPTPVEAVTAHVDERHEMPRVPQRPIEVHTRVRPRWRTRSGPAKWGGENWQHRVESSGYNIELIESLVFKGVGRKSESDVPPPIRTEYEPKH